MSPTIPRLEKGNCDALQKYVGNVHNAVKYEPHTKRKNMSPLIITINIAYTPYILIIKKKKTQLTTSTLIYETHTHGKV